MANQNQFKNNFNIDEKFLDKNLFEFQRPQVGPRTNLNTNYLPNLLQYIKSRLTNQQVVCLQQYELQNYLLELSLQLQFKWKGAQLLTTQIIDEIRLIPRLWIENSSVFQKVQETEENFIKKRNEMIKAEEAAARKKEEDEKQRVQEQELKQKEDQEKRKFQQYLLQNPTANSIFKHLKASNLPNLPKNQNELQEIIQKNQFNPMQPQNLTINENYINIMKRLVENQPKNYMIDHFRHPQQESAGGNILNPLSLFNQPNQNIDLIDLRKNFGQSDQAVSHHNHLNSPNYNISQNMPISPTFAEVQNVTPIKICDFKPVSIEPESVIKERQLQFFGEIVKIGRGSKQTEIQNPNSGKQSAIVDPEKQRKTPQQTNNFEVQVEHQIDSKFEANYDKKQIGFMNNSENQDLSADLGQTYSSAEQQQIPTEPPVQGLEQKMLEQKLIESESLSSKNTFQDLLKYVICLSNEKNQSHYNSQFNTITNNNNHNNNNYNNNHNYHQNNNNFSNTHIHGQAGAHNSYPHTNNNNHNNRDANQGLLFPKSFQFNPASNNFNLFTPPQLKYVGNQFNEPSENKYTVNTINNEAIGKIKEVTAITKKTESSLNIEQTQIKVQQIEHEEIGSNEIAIKKKGFDIKDEGNDQMIPNNNVNDKELKEVKEEEEEKQENKDFNDQNQKMIEAIQIYISYIKDIEEVKKKYTFLESNKPETIDNNYQKERLDVIRQKVLIEREPLLNFRRQERQRGLTITTDTLRQTRNNIVSAWSGSGNSGEGRGGSINLNASSSWLKMQKNKGLKQKLIFEQDWRYFSEKTSFFLANPAQQYPKIQFSVIKQVYKFILSDEKIKIDLQKVSKYERSQTLFRIQTFLMTMCLSEENSSKKAISNSLQHLIRIKKSQNTKQKPKQKTNRKNETSAIIQIEEDEQREEQDAGENKIYDEAEDLEEENMNQLSSDVHQQQDISVAAEQISNEVDVKIEQKEEEKKMTQNNNIEQESSSNNFIPAGLNYGADQENSRKILTNESPQTDLPSPNGVQEHQIFEQKPLAVAGIQKSTRQQRFTRSQEENFQNTRSRKQFSIEELDQMTINEPILKDFHNFCIQQGVDPTQFYSLTPDYCKTENQLILNAVKLLKCLIQHILTPLFKQKNNLKQEVEDQESSLSDENDKMESEGETQQKAHNLQSNSQRRVELSDINANPTDKGVGVKDEPDEDSQNQGYLELLNASKDFKSRELRNSYSQYVSSIDMLDCRSELLTEIILNIQKIEDINDGELDALIKHYMDFFEIFNEEKNQKYFYFERILELGREKGPGLVGCASSAKDVHRSIENYQQYITAPQTVSQRAYIFHDQEAESWTTENYKQFLVGLQKFFQYPVNNAKIAKHIGPSIKSNHVRFVKNPYLRSLRARAQIHQITMKEMLQRDIDNFTIDIFKNLKQIQKFVQFEDQHGDQKILDNDEKQQEKIDPQEEEKADLENELNHVQGVSHALKKQKQKKRKKQLNLDFDDDDLDDDYQSLNARRNLEQMSLKQKEMQELLQT